MAGMPCPECGGVDRYYLIRTPRNGGPPFWFCNQCRHAQPAEPGADLPRQLAPLTPEQQQAAHRAYAAAARYCQERLWKPEGARALAYLRGRGLSDETIKAAGLGYHPMTRLSAGLGDYLYETDRDLYEAAKLAGLIGTQGQAKGLLRHAVTIPYLQGGECRLIRGRRLDPGAGAKYLSPGGVMLYAGATPVFYLHDVLDRTNQVIVTEGEFKALLATQEWAAGRLSVPAVAHPGGSYFPPALIEALAGKMVYLVYDNERRERPDQPAPGERFTKEHGAKLRAAGIEVCVVVLPRDDREQKVDLDSFILANGAAALQVLIDTAPTYEEWVDQYERSLGPVPAVRVNERLSLAPRSLILSALFEEEAGDARLFAHLYRDRLAYDHAAGTWHVWAGHHWEEDRAGLVPRLVSGQLAWQYLTLAGELTKEAEAETDPERKAEKLGKADSLMKRARDLRKLRRLKNVLELARSWTGIAGDEWDSDPHLLGVANGVIELKKAGHFRAGHPRDYIRATAPTPWKGLEAPAPRFERFILEIFGYTEDAPAETKSYAHEMAAFARRLFGYGLIGDNIEHILPILHGERGRNGKDTLLHALEETLGTALAGPCSKDVIIDQARGRSAGSAQPHLLDLRGKRLAWASETRAGERLDAGQVKEITGGGTVAARGLYARNITKFRQTWLLCLMTNHVPRAPSDDDALWARVLRIPFEYRWVDNPTEPNERKRDPNLKRKLAQERSGILAWLVRGCLEYQEQGLNPPEAVKLSTEQYREEMDRLADFFADCCHFSPTAWVSVAALRAAYEQWAKEMGEQPVGSRQFAAGLKARGCEPRSGREHGRVVRGWLGIGLAGQSVDALTDVDTTSQKVAREGGKNTKVSESAVNTCQHVNGLLGEDLPAESTGARPLPLAAPDNGHHSDDELAAKARQHAAAGRMADARVCIDLISDPERRRGLLAELAAGEVGF